MSAKRYTVSAMVTISIHTEVEAKSKKEAIKIAEGRSMTDIIDGDRTATPSDECWVTSGELDGIPMNIEVSS